MSKSSITSGSQPCSVATGDFNNDHHLDIAVANSGKNTIGVFISHGNGTFANQETYFISHGSRPSSIITGHFNNDYNLDIAVANYGTNNIGIFLGNGNGTFSDQKRFSLGSAHPLFITTGDFNRDNRMDIVVANYGTNTISILLGYGNGYFQDQITYFTGYDSILYSLAIGDFNGDDHLDIATANYGTDTIGILLGYGNGTFKNQQTYTTLPKSNPSSVAVGDFNNDNHLDVVISNNGTSNVGIFLGHGNGTFFPQVTFPIGFKSHPQHITVGDFNKDKQLDIAIVDSANDQIHILLGYGNASFGTITTYDTISQSSPVSAAVADFDNDNQSDIVIANYHTNDVLVLTNYFIKPSTRMKTYDIGIPSTVNSVAVSDFNRDHNLDIVADPEDFILVLFGFGNGTFSRGVNYSVGYRLKVAYVCVGDINNDNQMDIVSAFSNTDSVGVLLGRTDGTFGTVTTYSTGENSSPQWIALGDINNDKRIDIVCANEGSDTIGILFGNGDGTFGTVITYFVGLRSVPNSVALGDINNDDYIDMVVVAEGQRARVILFLGQSDGTFTMDEFFLDSGDTDKYYSTTLADFDGDNNVDIVLANSMGNNISVLLGCGDGTFKTQTTYSTGSGSRPNHLIVDDFNNDNIYDIAVANFGTDEIVIFYGYGNGSFKLARTYSTGFGSGPKRIVAADFNNDKRLEIVVALLGTGDIAVLTEYYAADFVNQIKISTGAAVQPYAVAVEDLNNDNRSDIVVANSGTDNLVILFGIGKDMFGMEMTYPIGTSSQPQHVITRDINQDNQLDIISVNSKMNSISVIMNNGNGSFAKQRKYSTGNGSYPTAIASGDFNNDNRLDFVIANKGTDNIGIFLGFDYTSFHNETSYSSAETLGPIGIVSIDFNNDSLLDIAAVFFKSESLGILLGHGNGSFATMKTYSTGNGSFPYSIDVGDFNNDDQLDIVVTNLGTRCVGILLGYGNGNFSEIMTYSTVKNNPVAAASGDFNNDSRLDIAVANYEDNSIGILLGYGNGSFATVKIYSTEIGSTPSSIAVGDFNDDGILDIVVSNYGTDNIGILLGYGDGIFVNQVSHSTGYCAFAFCIRVADFNGDGQLDVVTSCREYHGIAILLGHGNGTFADVQYRTTGPGTAPQGISVGDFNNDKILDIAVVNSGTNGIVVVFGLGDGKFLLGKEYSAGIGSFPAMLAIGDFNNDSRLDIAVTNHFSNSIGIFFGLDSEPYAIVTPYKTNAGSQPQSVAVSDLNNDHSLDIVVANYGTDNVGILLGYGNGLFRKMMTYSTGAGSGPYCVASADFNNDNYFDIVVANSGSDNIIIVLGYGNGTFVTAAMYLTGDRSHPSTVAINDFNYDNILDIVVANTGSSSVFIFYGYGNGTFGNKFSYFLGYKYHPYSLVAEDINQDNLVDIVIACYGTDRIEVLIQKC